MDEWELTDDGDEFVEITRPPSALERSACGSPPVDIAPLPAPQPAAESPLRRIFLLDGGGLARAAADEAAAARQTWAAVKATNKRHWTTQRLMMGKYRLEDEDEATQRAVLRSHGYDWDPPTPQPPPVPPGDSPGPPLVPHVPGYKHVVRRPPFSLLFSYLDTDARLALRAASRQWRELADRLLGQHVVVCVADMGARRVVKITTRERRPVFLLPLDGDSEVQISPTLEHLLSYAFTVDIDSDDPTPLLRILSDRLPRLRTLRVNSPMILARDISLGSFYTPTAVLFSPDVPQTARTHAGCNLPSDLRSAVVHVVVDQERIFSPVPFWAHVGDVRAITLVLSLAEVPPLMRDIILKPASFLLQPIVELIAARAPKTKITIVSPKNIPARWFSIEPEPGAEDGVLIMKRIMGLTAAKWRYGGLLKRLPLDMLERSIAAAKGSVNYRLAYEHVRVVFFTTEEYRQSVGDATFALHTSGDTFFDPRRPG